MSDLTHLAGRIAAREAAATPPVLDGCEARIVWAGDAATETDLAIVYIHGFSASPEEIRPVPDRVAAALGANIYFARLTGHGQGGPAMADATLDAWRKDVDDALRIGRSLGRRTLLMGCSTGCTLGTLAAVAGAELAGVIHVSPNFALVPKALQWFVDLPGASTWGPWIAGRERVIEPISEAHDQFWTNRYPTRAIEPMVKAVRAVRTAKLGTITAPAVFLYCKEDKIVSPTETERTRARWGGPTAAHVVTLGPEDDENCHVIAGDVMSPSQNDGVVDVMVAWAQKAL